MKKKLLTILLSVFVMMTAFATRVFAEWTGSGSGTQTDPWLIGEVGNESCVTAYFDNGTLYINGNGKTRDAAVQNWAWYSIKDSITSGVIGDGVTYIGKSIFRECSNLTSVSIPNSVTSFGSTLFQDCTSLTTIQLPNALTKIGSTDFCGSGLTSITIPATVTQINGEAFKNCSSLSSVTVLNTTPPTLGDTDAFLNIDSSFCIYVPSGSVDAYKTANNWSTFADKIQAIPVTLGDIVPNNFPTEVASGWTNGTETIIKLNDSLKLSGVGLSVPYSTILSLDGNGNYNYSLQGATITFVMTSNVLTSIVVSNSPYQGDNGTYTPPKKISDILPSTFPDSANNGWIGPEDDYVAYKDSNFLNIKQKNSISVVFMIDKNFIVSRVSDNQYKYHDSAYDVLFNFDNNELISIQLTGVSDYRSILNGTYTKPLTVADILAKSTNTFPTSETSGWINANGKRTYINSNILTVSYNVPLESEVQKDGNNYKYVSGSQICTFVISSDELISINVSGAVLTDFNGDYVPYKYEIEPTGSIPKGYTGNLVFKTNGQYANDSEVEVKVNGTPLTLSSQYTVEHGSIKVTLLGDYLKNLAPGTYTLSIGVPGSYDALTSQFTIAGSSPNPSPGSSPRYTIPNTGVEGTPTNNHSLLKLSSLSLLAIGTYMVIKKKKDN